MAKEKRVKLEYELKVVKKLPSGMYATNKEGYNVPPYSGISIGDKVKIVNGAYVFEEKTEMAPIDGDAPVSRKEYEALLKKQEALEELLGEKGSDVKTGGTNATK